MSAVGAAGQRKKRCIIIKNSPEKYKTNKKLLLGNQIDDHGDDDNGDEDDDGHHEFVLHAPASRGRRAGPWGKKNMNVKDKKKSPSPRPRREGGAPLVDAAKHALALAEVAIRVLEAAAGAHDGLALVVEVGHDALGHVLRLGGDAAALGQVARGPVQPVRVVHHRVPLVLRGPVIRKQLVPRRAGRNTMVVIFQT
jgi:hypothetical protein